MILFIYGFICGALAIIVALMALKEKMVEPAPLSKRWSSITSAEFECKFDCCFSDKFKPTDVLRALPGVMVQQMEKKPINDDGIFIDGGNYSVELKMVARLVGREGTGK
jgi:hypothetical protein